MNNRTVDKKIEEKQDLNVQKFSENSKLVRTWVGPNAESSKISPFQQLLYLLHLAIPFS